MWSSGEEKNKKPISAGKLENYFSHVSRLSRVSLTRKKKLVLSRQFPLDRHSAVLDFKRSYPALPLVRQLVDQRFTSLGPLVQERETLSFHTPKEDRIRTVSQRTKPNSRTTFIGEQPNPWNLLQLQVVTSRHRGAKRPRRYGLLGVISLLSLAYL